MSIKATVSSLFLVLLITLPVYFVPRNVPINNLTCETQFGPCSEDLGSKLNEGVGESLLGVKKHVSGVLSAEPLVSDFSTHYKIPDRLEINVLLRKAHFGVRFETSDITALIDDEGHVLAYKEETSLPILHTMEPPPQVGGRVSDKQLFSLKLLRDMYEYYQVSEGVVDKEGLTFDLKDSREAVFPTEGDRQILIASLAVILTRLNADDSSTRIENGEGLQTACSGGCTIDLRYENPVIR